MGSDITYIPLNRGFMYLVAIMEKVLAWHITSCNDHPLPFQMPKNAANLELILGEGAKKVMFDGSGALEAQLIAKDKAHDKNNKRNILFLKTMITRSPLLTRLIGHNVEFSDEYHRKTLKSKKDDL